MPTQFGSLQCSSTKAWARLLSREEMATNEVVSTDCSAGITLFLAISAVDTAATDIMMMVVDGEVSWPPPRG